MGQMLAVMGNLGMLLVFLISVLAYHNLKVSNPEIGWQIHAISRRVFSVVGERRVLRHNEPPRGKRAHLRGEVSCRR
jgi:hypothetical protein